MQLEFPLPICSRHVPLASQIGLFLVSHPPRRQSFKDMHPCVSGSPQQGSGWFSPVSELTCEPPLCGRISQNSRFGGCVHWVPHYVGRGDSREGDRFLGATSLLAVLHSIFLADTFVLFLSSHSRLHCSITMNETIVLNTNVAFKSRLVPVFKATGRSVLNVNYLRLTINLTQAPLVCVEEGRERTRLEKGRLF